MLSYLSYTVKNAAPLKNVTGVIYSKAKQIVKMKAHTTVDAVSFANNFVNNFAKSFAERFNIVYIWKT